MAQINGKLVQSFEQYLNEQSETSEKSNEKAILVLKVEIAKLELKKYELNADLKATDNKSTISDIESKLKTNSENLEKRKQQLDSYSNKNK